MTHKLLAARVCRYLVVVRTMGCVYGTAWQAIVVALCRLFMNLILVRGCVAYAKPYGSAGCGRRAV